MNYERIVAEKIAQLSMSPVDILGAGEEAILANYLQYLKQSYVRTVSDLDQLFGSRPADKRILEIGSFLGVTSLSLKHLGYQIEASEIPEFANSPSLKTLYEQNGIPLAGLNLRQAKLPYRSGSLDAVILCEVMEHLNFNPLPVLKEINRVLRPGGFIYLAMPNQANVFNRLTLLLGKSIHNPIRDFFLQLEKNTMIIGLHWREYTQAETVEMIGKMGFETLKKYYFINRSDPRQNLLKRILRTILFQYGPFKPYQVVVGKKVESPEYNFWFTEANS